MSVVDSVFDPFSFVAPFILIGKKILQDLCRINLGWDDEVPMEHHAHRQIWLSDVPKLSQFMIDCCFKSADFMEIVSSQLHHFSDASEIKGIFSVQPCLSPQPRLMKAVTTIVTMKYHAMVKTAVLFYS